VPARCNRRVCVCALGALVALLVAAGPASAESLPVPPGFRLSASHGYTLRALALGNSHTGKGAILIFVANRTSSVFYATRAVVTETSIEADLGSVGRIDVDFVFSGTARKERGACGGKSVSFDSGRWEGVIDFHGEQGYSDAQVKSARGEGKLALSVLCAETVGPDGIGGNSPGALLTAHLRSHPKVEFEAMKNSPSRPARFTASIAERRGTMEISRTAAAVAGPGAFAFDIPSGTATVEPPAPFAGVGKLRRSPAGQSNWQGDLTVDFPGHRDVALTGAGTRASLVRAVDNPSHPFRGS
jgi:hypothetical protein